MGTRPALVLRTLTPADEAAFLAGLEAFRGEDPTWYSFVWQDGMRYEAMLEELDRQARGVGLPEGRVPATMFYAFVDGAIVGRLHVRHRLTPALETYGGHLGYAVAPAARGRGYATEMVRQALPFLRSLGLDEALATCGDTNVASIRVLEHLGARLVDTVERHDGLGRRYLVPTAPAGSSPPR